jgi:molybdopterin-guanine dinucleotide biosynthesis protein A
MYTLLLANNKILYISVMNVSIAVLAGGNSVRFGSDKTLIKLNGKAIIQYIVDEFIEIANLYIIAKQYEKYSYLNVPIIIDKYSEQSPLVGIITALENIESEYLFIVSADMPFIKKCILYTLINNIDKDTDIILPSINDKIYTLTGVYRRQVKSILERHYKMGNYKILDTFKNIKVKMLDNKYFVDSKYNEYSFININNWTDYKNAERILKKINKKS